MTPLQSPLQSPGYATDGAAILFSLYYGMWRLLQDFGHVAAVNVVDS